LYAEYIRNPNILAWQIPQLRNWTQHYEDFLNSGGSQFILNNIYAGTQGVAAGGSGGRRLQANPNVFNGPNPLNIPIGENFTDFTYVPLPGANAFVQPFG